MAEEFEFVGEVWFGRGRAASHIRENSAELLDKTKEQFVEGSLNLILNQPLRFAIENALEFDDGKRLLWPASLNGLPVWVYRWQHAPLHVVELLSKLHLRTELGLSDGDLVKVSTKRTNVGNVSPVGRLVWNLCWVGRRKWCYTNDRYYFRTKRWCRELGATQKAISTGGWNLAAALMKSAIRQTPILGSLAVALKKWSKSGAEKQKKPGTTTYVFERLPIDPLSDPDTRSFHQVRNILNYSKTSGSSYSAARYPAGYHTIDVNGQCLQGQRNPAKRLEHVPVDFRGKTVLDIGCNQGGMLFQIDGLVKWGVGVDYDARMINAANRIKALRQCTNLHFYVLDLQKEPLGLIEDFLPESKVDVVFLLSVCMWLRNWREVVEVCAGLSSSMLFETNGTRDQQMAQMEHLRELYSSVSLLTESSDDDPGQKRRQLIYCHTLKREAPGVVTRWAEAGA
jgi:SAM-dependent methyltransferase